MSDAILVQIISNTFWLILVLLVIVPFRKEIKNLISSLGRFCVAGAKFELSDKESTLKSYTILSGVLIEMLSHRDSAKNLIPIISERSAQELAKFAKQYSQVLCTVDTHHRQNSNRWPL
jgi:hypothetical protein